MINVPEFDQYADNYIAMHQQSVAFSGCDLDYFAEYKTAYAAKCFRPFALPDDSILDFGCGNGTSIPFFAKYLPKVPLVAADVSAKSLKNAEARFGSNPVYSHIMDNRLDLPTGSVGMAFTSCVFHHIKPEEHLMWLAELHRVVRPGGQLLIFEHNPMNFLTRYAVAKCAFDKDAILLNAKTLSNRIGESGWQPINTRYHVFFPGFMKKLRSLEEYLAWCPLGGQYSVLATKP